MILVCGEALVDLFVTRGADGHPVVDARVGGSPLNLAVGLARLGEPSGFFGGLSTDSFGRIVQAFLANEGVDLSCAPVSAAPSMQTLVGVNGAGEPVYSFPVTGGADRQITPATLPAALDAGVTAITFGSYPFVLEPSASASFALARREAGRRVICLDPNVRRAIIPDGEVWRRGTEAFLPMTDLAKASDEDIRACYGDACDLAEVARYWIGLGPSLVVVTRGAQGAFAVLRDGRVVEVQAHRVEVVDTVGAGDSFFAAMLSFLSGRGLLSRTELDRIATDVMTDVLGNAAAAAAVTCGRRGADLPTREDIGRMLSSTSQ